MKIHRFIQVLAIFTIVLHGTGAVRGLHNLTHHIDGVHSGASTAASEHLGDGFDDHSEPGHPDPSGPEPSDPDGEDCELCLALGSIVLSHSAVLESPLFTSCVEQRVRAEVVVCVLYSSFDHPARAPPLS